MYKTYPRSRTLPPAGAGQLEATSSQGLTGVPIIWAPTAVRAMHVRTVKEVEASKEELSARAATIDRLEERMKETEETLDSAGKAIKDLNGRLNQAHAEHRTSVLSFTARIEEAEHEAKMKVKHQMTTLTRKMQAQINAANAQTMEMRRNCTVYKDALEEKDAIAQPDFSDFSSKTSEWEQSMEAAESSLRILCQRLAANLGPGTSVACLRLVKSVEVPGAEEEEAAAKVEKEARKTPPTGKTRDGKRDKTPPKKGGKKSKAAEEVVESDGSDEDEHQKYEPPLDHTLVYIATTAADDWLVGQFLPRNKGVIYRAVDEGRFVLIPEVAEEDDVHFWDKAAFDKNKKAMRDKEKKERKALERRMSEYAKTHKDGEKGGKVKLSPRPEGEATPTQTTPPPKSPLSLTPANVTPANVTPRPNKSGALMAVPLFHSGVPLGVLCIDTVQRPPLLKQVRSAAQKKIINTGTLAAQVLQVMKRREKQLLERTDLVDTEEAQGWSELMIAISKEFTVRQGLEQLLEEKKTANYMKEMKGYVAAPYAVLELSLALLTIINMPEQGRGERVTPFYELVHTIDMKDQKQRSQAWTTVKKDYWVVESKMKDRKPILARMKVVRAQNREEIGFVAERAYKVVDKLMDGLDRDKIIQAKGVTMILYQWMHCMQVLWKHQVERMRLEAKGFTSLDLMSKEMQQDGKEVKASNEAMLKVFGAAGKFKKKIREVRKTKSAFKGDRAKHGKTLFHLYSNEQVMHYRKNLWEKFPPKVLLLNLFIATDDDGPDYVMLIVVEGS